MLATDRLALVDSVVFATLQAHQWNRHACRCGAGVEDDFDMALHQAEQLRLAGLALHPAPRLPAPRPQGA